MGEASAPSKLALDSPYPLRASSQLGEPSAPGWLAIDSPYPVCPDSQLGEPSVSNYTPSAGRAFRPQLACIRFLIRYVHPLSYPTFRPQIVYTNFTHELVGFSTVSYMCSIKGVCVLLCFCVC